MVLKILLGYSGGSLDHMIASVYNSCMGIRGFPGERVVSAEEIRRLWFEYSTFNPEEFVIVLYNGRVYGIAFTSAYGVYGRLWLCIDPELPRYYQLETIHYILSWAHYVFSSKRVSVVKISCGYEYSTLYNLIRSVLGFVVEKTSVTLMEYRGTPVETVRVDRDFIIRKATLDDVEGIVNVWNNTFRKYSWFEEWRVEDAIKWYSTRKLIVYVAVDKETNTIAGYVDGEIRKGVDGETYGYVYTLAVHPEKQGHGLGRSLLNTMIKELSSYNPKGIYLDALHGLEDYYSRQGFKIKRRYRILRTYTDSLPKHGAPYILRQDKYY